MKKTTIIYPPRIASKDCTSWQWPHRINGGKRAAKWVTDVRKRQRENTTDKKEESMHWFNRLRT